ncbi:MAG: helix-turn-helix transcriptional regulator [Planktothrix sp.]
MAEGVIVVYGVGQFRHSVWTTCPVSAMVKHIGQSSQEKSLAKMLAEIRKKLGSEAKPMSQEEFGHRIGVSSKTIYRWESGKNKPTFTPGQIKALLSLIEPLGMTLDDLPDE